MKIAVVSDWFSDGVGYAENFLPRALGLLGHEVHLLTSDFQIYATSPDYDKVYRARLGERKVGTGVKSEEGFTLHRLEGQIRRADIEIPQLGDALIRLSPQIVYCFEIACPTTVMTAVNRSRTGYRMFCESRLHSSILPSGFAASVKWTLRARMMGVPKVLKNVETFYPIAPDVLRNITRYLGVSSERCRLSSLAVETRTFHPSSEPGRRLALRTRLGLRETDLVCIYTGRLTPEKGPLVLARAVDTLQSRGIDRVRALFVGEGESDYVAQIASSKGCIVHPFVTPAELAGFYRCADIGVWPLQESTSQLDALACGLPLIVNDTVEDPIRLGDVGLTFRKDDVEHLASRVLQLENPEDRAAMGARAAARIVASCSWEALARGRVADFERALSG
jgi:glycosyltransferase involved in cell wall biosynthesis